MADKGLKILRLISIIVLWTVIWFIAYCPVISNTQEILADAELRRTPCGVSSCFQDLFIAVAEYFTNKSAEEELDLCPEILFSLMRANRKISECNGEEESGNPSGLQIFFLNLGEMFYEFCDEERNLTTKAELSPDCEIRSCFKDLYTNVTNVFTNDNAEEELRSLCPEAKNYINCSLEKMSECNVELSSNSSKHVKLLFTFEGILNDFCLGGNNLTIEASFSNRSSRSSAARWFNTVLMKIFFFNSNHGPETERIKGYKLVNWTSKSFNASLPIFILFHGYLPGTGDWQWRLKTALLSKNNCSVFIVDWEPGATTFYSFAMANMKYTGEKVGEFIINLKRRFPTSLGAVHIIGYSLGAHAAGYCGKKVRKVLSVLVDRITGLDPAGPKFRNVPSNRRLDYKDARLVDVIHTNGADDILKGFGIKQPIGHINFYPNGGEVQAGCETTSDVVNNFKDDMKGILYKTLFQAMDNIIKKLKKEKVSKLIQDLSCSHSRSTELFITSLTSCIFESVTCDSWENFSNCKNESSKLRMGFYANQNVTEIEISRKFYLKTKKAYPYC